jgi:hypothetical protein
MLLEINNDLLIKDIQKVFNAAYPFLKVEFFKKPHEWGAYSKEKEKCNPGKKIGSILKKSHPVSFVISPQDKTGDIEKQFHDLFGLEIQIYRRQNDHWIQSAGTDELSLEEQNSIGKKSAEDFSHITDEWIEKEKFL